MEDVLVTLIIIFLAYEFIEHVGIPVFWLLRKGKRSQGQGSFELVGKEGQIKTWGKGDGYLWVHGELWHAESDIPLLPGDKVVIQKINGLTLQVKSVVDLGQGKPPAE